MAGRVVQTCSKCCQSAPHYVGSDGEALRQCLLCRSLRQTWAHMIRRCYDKNDPYYYRYGGRGITVCDAWRFSFEAFARDMGKRPTGGHQIDRISNDGNYEPANCRWATRKEQCRNKSDNRLLTMGGRTLPIAEWAEETGILGSTIRARVDDGWTVERALTEEATPDKRLLTHSGKTQSIARWSEESGIPGSVISTRMNRDGWPVERALTTPCRKVCRPSSVSSEAS